MELQGALQVPQSTMLDNYMLLILGIMIITGVLGGVANYYMSDRRAETAKNEVFKYTILGIVAALTVPLFLNMISSNMLEVARSRPIDLFVFAGFCLMFVVFSRRFFENIANRLLQQVEQVRREVSQIKEAAAVDSTLTEPKTAEQQTSAKPDPAKGALTYNDVELMRTISEGKFVYGSISELAGETSSTKEIVTERLSVLKSMGLIELKINDKNVLHWYLSTKGKQFLAEVLSGKDENAGSKVAVS